MRGIQPSLTHCVWGEPTLVCRGWSAPCAMRHLLQVIPSARACVCVCVCTCASIKCRSQRCPEFLLHQSDAYSESARRRSRKLGRWHRAAGWWLPAWPLASPLLWDHPGLLIHLLATCLWSFSHLDLFASHQPKHSPHLFGSKLLHRDTPHLLISYEQQQPGVLFSDPNPSSAADQNTINIK